MVNNTTKYQEALDNAVLEWQKLQQVLEKYYGIDNDATNRLQPRKDQSWWNCLHEDIESIGAAASARRDATGPKAKFHSILGTLDSHKMFLELLPTSNEYIGIFCGAFKVILKASSTNKNVAESIPKGLERLGKYIEDARYQMGATDTARTRLVAVVLYKEIFIYLRLVVNYITGSSFSRLRKAFSDRTQPAFEEQLSIIKIAARDLFESGSVEAWVDTHQIRHRIEEHSRRYEADQEQLQAQLQARARAESLQALEYQRKLDSISNEVSQIGALLKTPAYAQVMTRQALVPADQTSTPLTLEAPPSNDRTHLDLLIAPFGALGTSATNAALALPAPQHLETPLVHELQDWLHTQASRWLWIQGTYERAYPSTTSAIAAALVRAGPRRDVLIAYQFCCPSCDADEEDDGAAGGSTLEDDAAVARRLLCSLLFQLGTAPGVDVDGGRPGVDLSRERLARVDDTDAGFDAGLALLEELVACVPEYTIVVIDGVDQIDFGEGGRRLGLLLETLRKAMLRPEASRVVKVLVTTAGDSSALRTWLEPSEIYDFSHWANKQAPGSARKGRSLWL